VVAFFGLTELSAVTVMGFSVDNEQGLKYRYGGDFNLAALTEFATKMLAKELTPIYKSEPVPAADDLPVTVVVGDNFDAIVMDPTKDVLLEVYAPWCGHCKKLAPIYKKLGKRFKDVGSVVIAKMDGTLNEHPKMMALVQGYPTLLLFPASADKAVVEVDADRTLAGLTTFLKANAQVPFELPKKEKASEDDAAAGKEEL
jgi:protein disulfide-isomerase A1